MRYLACLLILALAGCGDSPFEKPEARVSVHVTASNVTPDTSEKVTVSATLSTRNNPYFISFVWLCTKGPDAPAFMDSSATQTNVQFATPGDYTITLRIFYYDENNDRRTTESSVDITVSPAVPVGIG